MGVAYRIEQDPGVAYVVWDGTVTADQWMAHVRQLLLDPGWPPAGRLHLSDLRTATIDASIDDGVLKKAVELFGRHPNIANLRVAIVAGAEFRRAGVFERLSMRYPMFVFSFNTLRPACEWLGIDPDHAERMLRPLRDQARR
jgi:hypothetical protein